jgi:hypothetical protein
MDNKLSVNGEKQSGNPMRRLEQEALFYLFKAIPQKTLKNNLTSRTLTAIFLLLKYHCNLPSFHKEGLAKNFADIGALKSHAFSGDLCLDGPSVAARLCPPAAGRYKTGRVEMGGMEQRESSHR